MTQTIVDPNCQPAQPAGVTGSPEKLRPAYRVAASVQGRFFVQNNPLEARQQALDWARKVIPHDQPAITLIDVEASPPQVVATLDPRALSAPVTQNDPAEAVTLDELIRALHQLAQEEEYYVQHGYSTGTGSYYLEVPTHLPATPCPGVYILADAYAEAQRLIIRYHRAHFDPPLACPFRAISVSFEERVLPVQTS